MTSCDDIIHNALPIGYQSSHALTLCIFPWLCITAIASRTLFLFWFLIATPHCIMRIVVGPLPTRAQPGEHPASKVNLICSCRYETYSILLCCGISRPKTYRRTIRYQIKCKHDNSPISWGATLRPSVSGTPVIFRIAVEPIYQRGLLKNDTNGYVRIENRDEFAHMGVSLLNVKEITQLCVTIPSLSCLWIWLLIL